MSSFPGAASACSLRGGGGVPELGSQCPDGGLEAGAGGSRVGILAPRWGLERQELGVPESGFRGPDGGLEAGAGGPRVRVLVPRKGAREAGAGGSQAPAALMTRTSSATSRRASWPLCSYETHTRSSQLSVRRHRKLPEEEGAGRRGTPGKLGIQVPLLFLQLLWASLVAEQ